MVGVNPGPVPVHRALQARPQPPELHLQHQPSKLYPGMTTRSAPHRESYNCGTVAVFFTLNHQASVDAHNGHAPTSSVLKRVATVGSWLSSSRLHPRNLLELHNGTSNTLSMDCN